MHVISREANSTVTRARRKEVLASNCSLPDKIYIIDDGINTDSLATTKKSPNLRSSEMPLPSMPSFNLLEDDIGQAIDIESACEPGDTELNQPKAADTIFEHIRKKSKNYPALVNSSAMDASHQPMILTKNFTLKNRPTLDDREAELLQGASMIMIGSDPTEQGSSSFPMVIDVLSSPIKAERPTYNVSRSSSASAQAVGSKRAYPLESPNQVRDERGNARPFETETLPGDSTEVSFLGFKSVFSFL